MKDKKTAWLLAIFLWGLGIHKFYLWKGDQGIIYLLFCWTFIPAILGIIEGIIYLRQKDNDSFNKKFVTNKKQQTQNKEITNSDLENIKKLKELLDMWAITNEEFETKKKMIFEEGPNGKIESKSSTRITITKHPKTLFIFTLIVGMIVYGNLTMDPSEKTNNNQFSAEEYCKITIQIQLKDENSANFMSMSTVKTWDTTWETTGVVQAKNSFGAYTKDNFHCNLEWLEDGDKFKTIESKIGD